MSLKTFRSLSASAVLGTAVVAATVAVAQAFGPPPPPPPPAMAGPPPGPPPGAPPPGPGFGAPPPGPGFGAPSPGRGFGGPFPGRGFAGPPSGAGLGPAGLRGGLRVVQGNFRGVQGRPAAYGYRHSSPHGYGRGAWRGRYWSGYGLYVGDDGSSGYDYASPDDVCRYTYVYSSTRGAYRRVVVCD